MIPLPAPPEPEGALALAVLVVAGVLLWKSLDVRGRR